MAVYLEALVGLVSWLLCLALIANALLSFTSLPPWHPLRRFFAQIAEPMLRPFRNIIPPVGMLDLSPMVALIVIQVIGQVLVILIRTVF